MKRVLLSAVALLIACLSWENADAQRKPREVQEQAIKYQRLMQMIDAAYVDTVNLKKLTEDAIVKVLADLDPHSVYISKEEVEEANEPLDGGFFGIGIQFNVLNDTLLVVDVVAGDLPRRWACWPETGLLPLMGRISPESGLATRTCGNG